MNQLRKCNVGTDHLLRRKNRIFDKCVIKHRICLLQSTLKQPTKLVRTRYYYGENKKVEVNVLKKVHYLVLKKWD